MASLKNAWWDVRRKRGKRETPESQLGHDFHVNPPMASPPDTELRRREFRERYLEPCLNRVNERDRRMLLANHEDGEPLKEIAQREGISLDAAKAAVCRARHRVRECLIEKGLEFAELP